MASVKYGYYIPSLADSITSVLHQGAITGDLIKTAQGINAAAGDGQGLLVKLQTQHVQLFDRRFYVEADLSKPVTQERLVDIGQAFRNTLVTKWSWEIDGPTYIHFDAVADTPGQLVNPPEPTKAGGSLWSIIGKAFIGGAIGFAFGGPFGAVAGLVSGGIAGWSTPVVIDAATDVWTRLLHGLGALLAIAAMGAVWWFGLRHIGMKEGTSGTAQL